MSTVSIRVSSISAPLSNSSESTNSRQLPSQIDSVLLSEVVHTVTISPECITKFNDLKLNKKLKFILYKLTDDYKEVVVEEASEDGDWETFRGKLIAAESKNMKTGKVTKGPRYAVYDFNYDLASGEGSRSKICFIAWSPDDAGIQPKMVYASSKDALKRALNGLAVEVQGNDTDDIEFDTVLGKVSKGLA
ncbi:putative cofilin [Amylocarpus encephaloides]|uniref:Cofilin n=1 Tax=Amylocarpus encephaloides TaxID=45428 RepID=A0A9P7YM86_9HELO|nr:putative cofilin [Amylocarpus encephaloides]